jgi:hypothetical protein
VHFLFWLVESTELYSRFKGVCKVHPVLGEEGQTLPLAHDDFVEARLVSCRNVEVIGFGVVLPFLVEEEGESKLKEVEVEGCLLDPLVKFPMVSKESLDVLGLRG